MLFKFDPLRCRTVWVKLLAEERHFGDIYGVIFRSERGKVPRKALLTPSYVVLIRIGDGTKLFLWRRTTITCRSNSIFTMYQCSHLITQQEKIFSSGNGLQKTTKIDRIKSCMSSFFYAFLCAKNSCKHFSSEFVISKLCSLFWHVIRSIFCWHFSQVAARRAISFQLISKMSLPQAQHKL